MVYKAYVFCLSEELAQLDSSNTFLTDEVIAKVIEKEAENAKESCEKDLGCTSEEKSEIVENLLKNALDFLDEAVEKLSQSEPRYLKYSILHSSSAIELLLKYLLAQDDLCWIVEQKVKKDKLKNGNFTSIKFHDAMNKYEKNMKLKKMDLKEQHKTTLLKLKRERNKIEHFASLYSEVEVKSLVVKTWSFVLDSFYDDLLVNNISAFEDICRKMIKHQDFVKNRMEEILPTVNEHKESQDSLVIECPICLQDTCVFHNECMECLFCKSKFESEDFTSEWETVFIDKLKLDDFERAYRFMCCDCNNDQVFLIESESSYICFSCLQRFPSNRFTQCMNCSRIYKIEDQQSICDKCLDDIISRSD